MAKFSITFPAFVTSTSYKTAVLADAGTGTVEAEIVEALMTGGGSVTPADIGHRAALQRVDRTAAGTSTAQTPTKDDARSNASQVTGAVNFSAEPTTYQLKELLIFGFNQRGGMRWAVPIGQGKGITASIAAASKLGFLVISNAAGTVDATLTWYEP